MVELTVVVPVYNSEAILPNLVARLEPVLRRCTATFELVLVNDGSKDESWRVLQQVHSAHSWITVINLMRNYGQHPALLCGIRAASGRIIVTMDDDLQNPPEEIPKLLSALAGGYQLVYGIPVLEQHGFWRDFASRIVKLALSQAMGVRTARHTSTFRAFRASLRDAFRAYQSPNVSIDVMLSWGTTRIGSVVVEHAPRSIGTSQYDIFKLLAHAINMMTGFSTLPLRLASLAGFGASVFGLGVLVFVVGRYLLSGTTVAGFPFLAAVVAIFGGAQLFAIGIIGEYLARMHFRMLDRPPYVIEELRPPVNMDGAA
ncbi:MAG: glycosyltransferase family 2 protein [Acidobacteria bacterium]|nr:glycosyltransferase family 2 protein [Acidobacteriota bacterium]